MKLLKKVGAALVSLAMLAATALTTAAEETEGYTVYCAKAEMNSEEIYVLSVQNVPDEWVEHTNLIANIRFGNIEQKEWSENYVSFVVDGYDVKSAVFNSSGADENALSATLTKTEDNVYGMEMIFSIDSKYMKEFSNYNYAAVILVADISGEGDWQYITPDVQSEAVTYVVAPISWQDWTTPNIVETVEPAEEPTEPTEEPIESAVPEPTEEPEITEEFVEEPAETETPEVIAPDEPETEAPEAPAQAAPAESASAASTSNTNKGNPDTGVAVAVVPLLIAGAGTAVLTRKRK